MIRHHIAGFELELRPISSHGCRALVTLDLVNCTEVRSVPSPLYRDAIDDIKSIAARAQSAEEESGEGDGLADFLCPFQLLYSDGLERLGAEIARECVRAS